MDTVKNQMGLFDLEVNKEKQENKPQKAVKAKNEPVTRQARKTAGKIATKVSGLIPAGDVRLTANIRQDLHLKLKIAAAHQRTTIGELLEKLIEKHI
jgi:hypothetical protein